MSPYSVQSDSIEKLKIIDGCLSIARCVFSPNFNERPDNIDISLLVIHNISLPPEQFGDDYIEHFFCNQLENSRHPYFQQLAGVKVSSHLLITRQGEIIQFVPFHKRAWHAGASCFDGRKECNDFSIGIELEGADNIPYTDAQYLKLSTVSKKLMQDYAEISIDRIVGHSDIAPGRKTDPGPAFDWQRFHQCLE